MRIAEFASETTPAVQPVVGFPYPASTPLCAEICEKLSLHGASISGERLQPDRSGLLQHMLDSTKRAKARGTRKPPEIQDPGEQERGTGQERRVTHERENFWMKRSKKS